MLAHFIHAATGNGLREDSKFRLKEELERRRNSPDALEIISKTTPRVLLRSVHGFLLDLEPGEPCGTAST